MAGGRCLRIGLTILLLAGAAPAAALTGMRVGGAVYAPADAVARALGDIVVAGEGSLTWRAASGTLTVFAGSPDALWQPAGDARPRSLGLSAPPLVRGGRWWLPLDAFDTLGVRVHGTTLTLPDGRALELALPAPPAAAGDGRSRVDDLGNGVLVLRLFASPPAATTTVASGPGSAEGKGDGTGGPAVAAMLADLDMLPLIDPKERAVIDAALEGSAPDKPLLVVVTALAPSAWQARFTLSQGQRSLALRYPYRMRLVSGSATRVAPERPASVLLLLPAWFDLYRPITVSWQGVSASITFRR